MPGVAAFLVALAALAGQSPAGAAGPLGVHLVGAPHVRIVVVPRARPARLRSCSAQRSQPGPLERKILPVACEQPPRSRVTLPPSAMVLAPLVGG
jgi:hypothetical protein